MSQLCKGSTPTSQINLPFITADATGPKHLDLTLTQAKFNELHLSYAVTSAFYCGKLVLACSTYDGGKVSQNSTQYINPMDINLNDSEGDTPIALSLIHI